jgi:uncharacterized Fe-S cluster-containing radical SAM superfamily protein
MLNFRSGSSTPTAASLKFRDPEHTAQGEPRASVTLTALKTIWFNTGSLCNITCANCYIESSPSNDRLAYLSAADVGRYLDEARREGMPVEDVGFTGGEPFMNRELPQMLADTLGRGLRALVLSNGMKPLLNRRRELLALRAAYGEALTLRVSIDHYEAAKHEKVRGPGTWPPMMEGVRWLAGHNFRLHIAGRKLWDESEAELRAGFASLFAREKITIDADDPASLVLFPEMDLARDVPEITTRCWEILGKSPDQMMCASSRMIIRRKGAAEPVVVPCTLLPYDPQFELGNSLATSPPAVRLNHPFCAQFCVLGGASCSAR